MLVTPHQYVVARTQNLEKTIQLVKKQYDKNKIIKTELYGLFGWPVSVTQFSVSITHSSKMVGPIAKRLFGKSITLFSSLNYLIFEL